MLAVLAGMPAARLQAQRLPESAGPTAWVVWSPEAAAAAPTRRWVAPLASMILPGSGQLIRRQDRGAVYLVAEAFLAQRFLSLRSAALMEENRYRDLALRVARAPFDPALRDTIFEYFEQMGTYVESGPFDSDAGPTLAPPVDQDTYNGSIWALARQTYLRDPAGPSDTASTEYRAALDFYRRRAVGPNFRWSWRNAPLEQDLYRQTIRRGDETFRRATRQLGLLLANHVLSAVDAFVSNRRGRDRSRLEHRIWIDPRAGQASVHLFMDMTF